MTTTSTPYSASDVANYFIFLASQPVVGDDKQKEGITNLKLQKILYLAQAYFLARLEKPLFGDKIEAWEYGPVVPSVYHEFKIHGSDSIFEETESDAISSEDKESLKEVWDAFGGYSATKLVSITHAHKPWRDAHARGGAVITEEALKEYYAPLL